MSRFVFSLAAAVALAALQAQAVTISTIPIGDPGNPHGTRYVASGIGSVPYSFRIGETGITNAQYVEFLNAVAASDPYELYRDQMGSDTRGGIIRSGSAGNYTYAVKPPVSGQGLSGSDYYYDNKPVVYISWFKAIRFANWLHNGQGSSDTESGAYTMLGGTPIPSNVDSIIRNPGARWFVPSEDEWYKAAYYDPSTGAYYDYPTSTNNVPNNNPPSADTGNSANFGFIGSATGNSNYPLTDVDAYGLSLSPYKTLDQGGNVAEWTENLGYRGADWFNSDASFMHASFRRFLIPAGGGFTVGFRVATVIPEPSTLLLLSLGVVVLLTRHLNPGARRG